MVDIIIKHSIKGRKVIAVPNENISIKDLIDLIKKEYNYDNDIVRIKLLLTNGSELAESKNIADYGIAHESTIQVIEIIDSLILNNRLGVIKNKNFNGTDFTDVDFSSLTFENCIFDNCNLTNANFKNTNLHFISSSNIIGEPLNLRDDYKIVEIDGVRQILSYGKIFKNMNITNINLTGIQLGYSKFINCKLSILILNGTKLSGSEFTNTEISDCELHDNCDLRDLTINGLKSKNIDFKGDMDNLKNRFYHKIDPSYLCFPYTIINGCIIGPKVEIEDVLFHTVDFYEKLCLLKFSLPHLHNINDYDMFNQKRRLVHIFKSSFRNCQFINCNLANCNFSNGDFTGSVFDNIFVYEKPYDDRRDWPLGLRKYYLDQDNQLKITTFDNSILYKTTFKNIEFKNKMSFVKCNLDLSKMTNLKTISFWEQTNAGYNSDFATGWVEDRDWCINFSKSSMRKCDLSDSDMSHANLSDVNFEKSILRNCNLNLFNNKPAWESYLNGDKSKKEEILYGFLKNINFYDSDLRGAHLPLYFKRLNWNLECSKLRFAYVDEIPIGKSPMLSEFKKQNCDFSSRDNFKQNDTITPYDIFDIIDKENYERMMEQKYSQYEAEINKKKSELDEYKRIYYDFDKKEMKLAIEILSNEKLKIEYDEHGFKWCDSAKTPYDILGIKYKSSFQDCLRKINQINEDFRNKTTLNQLENEYKLLLEKQNVYREARNVLTNNSQKITYDTEGTNWFIDESKYIDLFKPDLKKKTRDGMKQKSSRKRSSIKRKSKRKTKARSSSTKRKSRRKTKARSSSLKKKSTRKSLRK